MQLSFTGVEEMCEGPINFNDCYIEVINISTNQRIRTDCFKRCSSAHTHSLSHRC